MLNDKGQEVPDPNPVEVPLKFRGQTESLHEKILRYIRSEEFRQKAEAQGFETEDEANDFEVEEDEGADLPISHAEAAMMIAEELQVRKQDLLDMEGKVGVELRKKGESYDRGVEGDQKGSTVVQEGREASRGEGEKRGADVKETK